MARDRRKRSTPSPAAEEAAERPRRRPPSMLALWLEEAWHGWLKSVGLIVACLVAYLLYRLDLVSERLAGVVAVGAVVVGVAVAALLTALPLLPARWRPAFWLFVGVWLVGVGYAPFRAVAPPTPLAEAALGPTALAQKVRLERSGPIELTVRGRLAVGGPAEEDVRYTVHVDSPAGNSSVSGDIRREVVRFRSGRKGGVSTSVSEHSEVRHLLPSIGGGDVTFSTDSIDPKLEGGLRLVVRAAPLDWRIFLALSALAALAALFFDARLVDRNGKGKTWLAAAVGTGLAFSLVFPPEASTNALVRPAVGALFEALVMGGLPGWLLGLVVRFLGGPKVKKARR